MARDTKELTDAKIRTAKPKDKDYKLSDAQGLYLLVTKGGGKHWKMKYLFEGKEQKLSLGEYKLSSKGEQIGTPLATQTYTLETTKEIITLIGVRTKRDEALALLSSGANPIEISKEKRKRQKVEDVN